MTKTQYLRVCMRQDKAWLCDLAYAYDSDVLGSHAMRPIHRAIVGIAIRHKA